MISIVSISYHKRVQSISHVTSILAFGSLVSLNQSRSLLELIRK